MKIKSYLWNSTFLEKCIRGEIVVIVLFKEKRIYRLILLKHRSNIENKVTQFRLSTLKAGCNTLILSANEALPPFETTSLNGSF